jgi:hypothetical protein
MLAGIWATHRYSSLRIISHSRADPNADQGLRFERVPETNSAIELALSLPLSYALSYFLKHRCPPLILPT